MARILQNGFIQLDDGRLLDPKDPSVRAMCELAALCQPKIVPGGGFRLGGGSRGGQGVPGPQGPQGSQGGGGGGGDGPVIYSGMASFFEGPPEPFLDNRFLQVGTGLGGQPIEARAQWPANRAATLTNFRIFVSTNTADIGGTLRVRVNGVDQAVFPIAPGFTGVLSPVAVIAVANADLLSAFLEIATTITSSIIAVLVHDFI